MTDLPLVSIAIPLFRSGPFIDRIIENIGAIDMPEAEILISDRHQDDDAIERLARRLSSDRRIRFLRATDRIGWVDHYNLLLTEARGRYFMWMPHDDHFPRGYVAALVGAMESDPSVVLGYADMHQRRLDDQTVIPEDAHPLPRLHGREDWRLWMPLKLLLFTNLYGVAFRGLFRRDRLCEANLTIRHSSDDILADAYWMFAVALSGRFRYVPGVSCTKHFHSSNTHTRWRPSTAAALDRFRLPLRYLLRARGHRWRRLLLYTPALLGWSTYYLFRLAGVNLPAGVRRWVRKHFPGGQWPT